MLYTSEHYSTAMLEKLVRGSGFLPPNQHYVEITVPNGISYEMLNPPALPDWDHAAATAAKRVVSQRTVEDMLRDRILGN